jgi:hypothetical protein
VETQISEGEKKSRSTREGDTSHEKALPHLHKVREIQQARTLLPLQARRALGQAAQAQQAVSYKWVRGDAPA